LGCQPSGVFELVEAAFDNVAQGIDRGIDGQLDEPVPLGRDHGGDSSGAAHCARRAQSRTAQGRPIPHRSSNHGSKVASLKATLDQNLRDLGILFVHAA